MIENYSLAYIRAQLLANPSIEEVVAELNVTLSDLQEHLAQFEYKGERVTVEFLKTPHLEDFIDTCGTDYSRPQNRDFKISYSLKQIHALILTGLSEKKVAEALGIVLFSLTNRILRFRYQGQYLTFNQLQHLKIEDAQNVWGAQYTKPLSRNIDYLSIFTFAKIHFHIRETKTLYNAANTLGVSDKALCILLIRADIPYEFLKNKSEEELRNQFGDDYDKPIKNSIVDLAEVTLAAIHDKALAEKKISPTAHNLGVFVPTLTQCLARVAYNGAYLTFDDLSTMDKRTAEEIWKEKYNKPLKEIYASPLSLKRKRSEEALDQSNDESQQEPPPFPMPVAEHYSQGSSSFFKPLVVKDNILSREFAKYVKKLPL